MQIEQYEPLGAMVLLQVVDDALEMKAGIIIPDIAKAKSNKGRVVAVGEGLIVGGQLIPIKVTVGDVVLFSKYGGTEVNLDGNEYMLVRYDELFLRQRQVALVTHG
jgi:chaperonin GroES